MSEISVQQSSPEYKIAIYYTTENNLVLDLDLELFNWPINKSIIGK